MLPPVAGIVVRFLGELVIAISVGIVGWFGVVTAMVQSGQMITALGVSRDLYSVPIVWMAASMMLAIVVKSLTRFDRLSGAEAI
jgi:TRAP-type C4-dicarboxylate transport system permease small subunit